MTPGFKAGALETGLATAKGDDETDADTLKTLEADVAAKNNSLEDLKTKEKERREYRRRTP